MTAKYLGPWKLRPSFTIAPEAGKHINDYKNIKASDCIAESWEASAVPGHLSVVACGPDAGLTIPQLIEKYGEDFLGKRVAKEYGTDFPLLVKLIYNCGEMNLHVHTPDPLAEDDFGVLGREELWYVVDAPEGAEVLTGFNEVMTREEFENRVSDGTIVDYVVHTPARKGDVFYIPAGRPHSLTPGVILLELFDPTMGCCNLYSFTSGNSNVDIDKVVGASDAVELAIQPSYRSEPEPAIDGTEGLAHTSHFSVNRLTISGRKIFYNYEHSFLFYHCIEGEVKISTSDKESAVSLHRGESMIVGGSTRRIVFDGAGVVIAAHM